MVPGFQNNQHKLVFLLVPKMRQKTNMDWDSYNHFHVIYNKQVVSVLGTFSSQNVHTAHCHLSYTWQGPRMHQGYILTSTSLLLATSEKFSCCSRVLSTLSSVIQKHRNLASMGSCDLAKTTNLAIYGTQIISLYTCDAKETDSWICRQSISQNLQKERKPVT